MPLDFVCLLYPYEDPCSHLSFGKNRIVRKLEHSFKLHCLHRHFVSFGEKIVSCLVGTLSFKSDETHDKWERASSRIRSLEPGRYTHFTICLQTYILLSLTSHNLVFRQIAYVYGGS
jgi:hypothetical protein